MRKVGMALAWDVRAREQQAAAVGEPGQRQDAAPSRAQPGAEDGYCKMLSPLIHPTYAPREPRPRASGPSPEHSWRRT